MAKRTREAARLFAATAWLCGRTSDGEALKISARNLTCWLSARGQRELRRLARRAESGARVAVVDDNPAAGGQIWRGGAEHSPSTEASEWHARLARANVSLIYGAKVVARESADVLVAETWERTLKLKFAKLVIATGARERFLPFPGWTLPGVMGAGGLQALVKSGLSVSGKRVVIAGSGPLLLAVAEYLRRAGAEIILIAEQAPAGRVRGFAARLFFHPAKFWQAIRLRRALGGVPYHFGMWPVAAGGAEKLEWVELVAR